MSYLSHVAFVAGATANAHGDAIVGLHADSANKIVVSVDQAGNIKSWQFRNRRLKLSIQIRTSVLKSAFHGGTCLLAVADHVNTVRALDMTVGKVVRIFKGMREHHRGSIPVTVKASAHQQCSLYFG